MKSRLFPSFSGKMTRTMHEEVTEWEGGKRPAALGEEAKWIFPLQQSNQSM